LYAYALYVFLHFYFLRFFLNEMPKQVDKLTTVIDRVIGYRKAASNYYAK